MLSRPAVPAAVFCARQGWGRPPHTGPGPGLRPASCRPVPLSWSGLEVRAEFIRSQSGSRKARLSMETGVSGPTGWELQGKACVQGAEKPLPQPPTPEPWAQTQGGSLAARTPQTRSENGSAAGAESQSSCSVAEGSGREPRLPRASLPRFLISCGTREPGGSSTPKKPFPDLRC